MRMMGVSKLVCVIFSSLRVNFLANNIVVLGLSLGPRQFERFLVHVFFGRGVEIELEGEVIAESE